MTCTVIVHICCEVMLHTMALFRPATGVLSNINHKKNPEYRPNIDHTALYRPNFNHKSSLKSVHVFTRFATKVRMFIRAGLYPTSQEIQGAGRYFHMTSFNGRVHFEVLRFVIFQIIGKIYQHSEIFW